MKMIKSIIQLVMKLSNNVIGAFAILNVVLGFQPRTRRTVIIGCKPMIGIKRTLTFLILLFANLIYARQIPTVTGLLKTSAALGTTVTIGTPSATNAISVATVAGTSDYKIQNQVALKYDLNTDTFFAAPAVVRVQVTINRNDASGSPLSTVTRTLTISINNQLNVPFIEQSQVNLTNGYTINMTIDSIWVNGVSVTTLPRYVSVESEINMDRYYDFSSPSATSTGLSGIVVIDDDCDTYDDNIEVNWATPAAIPEEYQLEWTYVNNYDGVGGVYSPSSFDADFKNNSTRISTTANNYKLSLLFDQGYIAFRVRAVGRDYLNPTKYVYGPWSSPDVVNMGTLTSLVDRYDVTTEHEKLKNWQYSSTYAEEGKKKEVIQYFDGSLHNRQSVTKVNSDKNVIVGETMYDYQGRAAINTLPVPVNVFCGVGVTGEPAIKYYNRFNLDDTSKVYSKNDFDEDLSGSCNSAPAPMDTVSGSSQYYSNNNPNQTAHQSFVPHAKEYPFTQTEYTPDNTGRIRKQSGVGIDYQFGSGKETQYFYGQPNQIQVDRLFGSEAGDVSHYKKNVVIDANKQSSVTYLNQEGKTVATALAGIPPNLGDPYTLRLDSLDYISQNQNTLSVDFFNKDALGKSKLNTIPASNDRIDFSSQLLVTYTSFYEFSYNIEIDTLVDPCLRSGVCVNCIYDMEIQVKDECGVNLVTSVTPFKPIKRVTGKVDTTGGVLTFNIHCDDSPSRFHDTAKVTLSLDPGVYTVSKVLTINKEALDFYTTAYLDSVNNSCFKTLSDFKAEELAKVDTSDCYNTCSTCAAELGTKDDYVSSGRGTAEQWEFLMDECLEPCRQENICKTTYDMMLSDVTPGGQYGKFDAATLSAASETLSVFNPANLLNSNVLSSNQANWQHPFMRLNGKIYHLYLDEHGVRTKVNVSLVSPGVYAPPVTNTLSVYTDPKTGTEFTYPENLQNFSDFLPIWDPNFAKSLVTFHPEFAYYLSCSDQAIKFPGHTRSSNDFDSLLYVTETFTQAVSANIITSMSTYTNPAVSSISKLNAFWSTSSGTYDPFFTDTIFQYSTVANPITGSKTNINMSGAASYKVNLKSEMNTLMTSYKYISGTWYSMPDIAALITRCGSAYGGTPAATCIKFGTDYYPGGSAILNDSIRDAEWRLLKQMYLSEKQKLQYKRMDFYAKHLDDVNSNYYGGCNACIGNKAYDAFASGMIIPNASLFPPIETYPITAHFDPSQPCGAGTDLYYRDAIKRFYDPNNLGAVLDTASLAHSVYLMTGQCPMAFELQNFLKEMAFSSNLNNAGPITLGAVGAFSPNLYKAVSGGTVPAVYTNYEWSASSASGILSANITNPTTSLTVCTLTLDASSTPISSFSDIVGFEKLGVGSGGPYTFTAIAVYTVGATYNSANITGTTSCVNIHDCDFSSPPCSPNQFASDISNLMSYMKTVDSLTIVGVKVPVYSSTTMSKFLTPDIKSVLGTPTSSLVFRYFAPDKYVFYDSLNPSTKIVLTLTISPSSSYTNVTTFSNIKSNYGNLFKMDGLDISRSKIVDIDGSVVKITSTDTIGISMGSCGYPDLPGECKEKEQQVRKDLQLLVREVLTRKPIKRDLDILKLASFSPVLKSYFTSPLADTNGVYHYTTTASPNYDTLIYRVLNASPQFICYLKLMHYRNNGTTLNFSQITNISDLVGIGSLDGNGNYSNFRAIATYSSGAKDTIYGTSCFPIKNCVPVIQDSAFVFPPDDKYDNPCVREKINRALFDAENNYKQYMDSMTTAFVDKYTKHCLGALENFNYNYVDKEYHYTLYYYDQAGNLIKTVPPEGVEFIPVTSFTQALAKRINEDRTFNRQTIFTKHRMATSYVYNSLNQLIYQTLPDHNVMGGTVCSGLNTNGLDTSLVIQSLQFVSPNKGYLSGYIKNSVGHKLGYVYTTNDAGTNWEPVHGVTSGDFQKIQLVSSTDAFAVSTFGMVFKTSDYGNNWELINSLYNPTSGNPYINTLYSLLFTSTTNGIVGGIKTGSDSPMYYTTDGGITFSPATVSGAVAGDTITEITYDGTTYVASAKHGNSGSMFKSTTGSSWTKVTNFAANNLRKVQFFADSMAFAVGEEGTLLKLAQPITSGNGPKWQLIPTGVLGHFNDIYFKDQNNGVALIDSVSGKAKIWKTFNGGVTWSELSEPGDYYNSLQLYDTVQDRLIASGKKGLIAKVLMHSKPFGMIKLNAPSTTDTKNNMFTDAKLDASTGGLRTITVADTCMILASYNAQALAPDWFSINTTTLGTPITGSSASFKKVLLADSNSASPAIKAIILANDGKLYSLYRDFNASTVICQAVAGLSGTEFFNDITSNARAFTTPVYAYDTVSKTIHVISFSGALANATQLTNAASITKNVQAIAIDNSPSNKLMMVGNTGHIRYTDDITVTPVAWRDSTLNTIPVAINRVKAIAANNFIAVGQDGSLWKNSSTADDWYLRNSGTVSDFNAVAVDAGGNGLAGANNGNLYQIVGGTAPSPVVTALSIPEVEGNFTDIALGIYGYSNDAFITASDGNLLYTDDYTIPSPSFSLTSKATDKAVNGVCYKTVDAVLAVGDDAFVSDYLGTSAVVTQNLFPRAIQSIHFYDSNNGACIDSNNVIRTTTDGGVHWSVIVPQSGSPALTKVFSTAPNQAIVIGLNQYAAVVNSNTLTAISIPTTIPGSMDFNDINFDNANNFGVIVGSSSHCVKISPSGSTFSLSYIGQATTVTPVPDLNAVHVFNNNTFITAGTKGAIYYHKGSTFTKQTNYTPPAALTQSVITLKDIFFLDEYNGYVVGSNSAAYKVALDDSIGTYGTSVNSMSWTPFCNQAISMTYTSNAEFRNLDFNAISYSGKNNGMIAGADSNITLGAYTPNRYARVLRDQTADNNGGGISGRFWYDRLGRMILSQNTKQYYKVNPADPSVQQAYSYTLYDALGRIIEVGEKYENHVSCDPKFSSIFGALVSGAPNAKVIDDTKFLTWIYSSGGRHEVTKTYYDEQDILSLSYTQNNLRKRVATTTYEDVFDGNDLTYNHATHFSYDIHGNVNTLWQENTQVAVSGQYIKQIDYEYDLISGKVNKVIYQPGSADQFAHRYTYDADNRITKVETTSNPELVEGWQLEAKYFYYAHGPLARVEYGKNQVQGVDYAYTLQGWIKGVNSNTLKERHDMGQDGNNAVGGNPNANFARDAFGYTLNYYQGDYNAINFMKWNTASSRFESYTSGSDVMNDRNDLYNGNISSMMTTIIKPSVVAGTVNDPVPMPLANAYHYDQLNRIKHSLSFNNIDTASNAWLNNGASTPGLYRNVFTFDANGNINTQMKYDSAGVVIDSLVYNYETISGKMRRNRLYHVNDMATTPGIADDIEDQGAFTSGANINISNNYRFDEIGNLVYDAQEQIDSIRWNVYGKIKAIVRSSGSAKDNLYFDYDASGNRIAKHNYTSAGIWKKSTYYVRDAQGNVLSVYNKTAVGVGLSYMLNEQHLYGSSRLGMANPQLEMIGASAAPDTTKSYLGFKQYELSNHLGNVLSVISDKKIAIVSSGAGSTTIDHFVCDQRTATDYFPYGSPLPGRTFTLPSEKVDTIATEQFASGTGGFLDYLGGYVSTLSNSSGTLKVKVDPTYNTFQATGKYYYTFVPNKVYKVTYDVNMNAAQVTQGGVQSGVNNSFNLSYWDNFGITAGSSGTYTFTFKATQTSHCLQFDQAGSGSDTSRYYTVDNIYIEEITAIAGNVFASFNGQMRDDEVAGFGNINTAEYWEYDSRSGRRWNVDPVTHPELSPYSTFNNNPIFYTDPNGDDWDVKKSKDKETGKERYDIKINAKLFNNSKKDVSPEALKNLATAMKSQIEKTYNFENKDVIVNTTIDIQVVTSITQIGETDHLFAIVDQDLLGANVAADNKKGSSLIRIGSNQIDNITKGINPKSVPHELGHSGGLDHPHSDKDPYKINPDAIQPFEFVPPSKMAYNLMSQGWVPISQKVQLSNSTNVTNSQIRLIHLNYINGNGLKINRNTFLGSYHGYKTLNGLNTQR